MRRAVFLAALFLAGPCACADGILDVTVCWQQRTVGSATSCLMSYQNTATCPPYVQFFQTFVSQVGRSLSCTSSLASPFSLAPGLQTKPHHQLSLCMDSS